jgi:hypothetical protein
MTDSPRTIDALIDALRNAQERAAEARSAKQRTARHNAVLRAALALYERLGELRVWLDREWDDANTPTPRDYESHREKYERGWDALNAAAGIIPQWLQDHGWEETDEDLRPRTGSRPAPAPRQTREGPKLGRSAPRQPPRADRSRAQPRDDPGVEQRALL